MDEIAERIAQRSVAKRGANYTTEVRRLLDAGLEVMRECSTDSRPRVSDIVTAAGLSNEAFYRHFPSKDALVAAILEDGAARLRGYLEHQMAKESDPARQVRRWVEGVLAQAADPDIAATILAVLRNAVGTGDGIASGHSSINAPLGSLLHDPFAALGSRDPTLDAALASHAVVGLLSDYLRRDARPSRAEIRRVVDFCLAGTRP
jgi:AcrR family transcriptional regulator